MESQVFTNICPVCSSKDLGIASYINVKNYIPLHYHCHKCDSIITISNKNIVDIKRAGEDS